MEFVLIFSVNYGKLTIVLYRNVLIGFEVLIWKQKVDFILHRSNSSRTGFLKGCYLKMVLKSAADRDSVYFMENGSSDNQRDQ